MGRQFEELQIRKIYKRLKNERKGELKMKYNRICVLDTETTDRY